MDLTALAIRNAKQPAKPYKLFDERSLFLLIRPNGSKILAAAEEWLVKVTREGRADVTFRWSNGYWK